MKIGFLSLVLSIFALNAFAAQADAEAEVRDILARSGVRVGVDSAKSRYVFVGTSAFETVDPASDADFLNKRERCARVAELKARRDLIKARMVRVSMKDSAQIAGDGKGASVTVESLCKFIAEDKQHGAVVLCSAESWNSEKKSYRVSVAVGWGATLEATGAILRAAPIPSGDLSEDDPAWAAWAKSVSLASVMGSRQFKDVKGTRRIVGIGVADVEGRTGLRLKSAMRLAQASAKRNLAFAVYSDATSREVAWTMMADIQRGDKTEQEVWESFESKVSRQCNNMILRAHEVYSTTELKHPVTGRRMYVSIYGIEPGQE